MSNAVSSTDKYYGHFFDLASKAVQAGVGVIRNHPIKSTAALGVIGIGVFAKFFVNYRERQDFQQRLNDWVGLASGDEKNRRVEASKRIYECYRNNQDKLDLSFLGLTSIPECINQCSKISAINLFKNQLTDIPEHLLVRIKSGEDIFIADNPIPISRVLDLTNQIISEKERNVGNENVKKTATELLMILIEALNKITEKENCNGFVYKLKNESGVDCYLVGTSHEGITNMVNNRQLFNMLYSCSELVTELGEDVLRGLLPDCHRLNKTCMDYRLNLQAAQKKIKLTPLDSWETQGMIVRAISIAQDAGILTLPNDNDLTKGIRIWLEGDENAATVFVKRINDSIEAVDYCRLNSNKEICRKGLQLFLGGRNAKWLENSPGKPGLIEKIQAAKNPICIAVGQWHLFGPEGLIQGFKKAGICVDKISLSNQPASLPDEEDFKDSRSASSSTGSSSII